MQFNLFRPVTHRINLFRPVTHRINQAIKTYISAFVSILFLLTYDVRILLIYYLISLIFERKSIMILHHLVSIWYFTGGFEVRVIHSTVLFKIADLVMYVAKLTDHWLAWLVTIIAWIIFRIMLFVLLWSPDPNVASYVSWINNTIGIGLVLVNIYWLKNLAKKFNKSFTDWLDNKYSDL